MSNRCVQFHIPLRLAAALAVALLAVSALADETVGPPAPDAGAAATTQPTDAEPTTQPAGTKTSFGRTLALPKDDDRGSRNVMSELLAMVVVIAVIGGIAWFVLRRVMPRFRMAGPKRNVRVVETTFLNPRQSVVLLEVGKRRLLLATTRERVSMLADVTDAETRESAHFAEKLRKADDGFDSEDSI